ncbi:MAG: glyceraldehyde 3-phosphate dehydrogenase N-terminal domain-containing protein [Desulfosudis oleivorans]|nr:glyceraldehyde 3-phosphate dehydrogenase N-terminal domain-containing protein [Desulfosudis oleivorans]
MAINDITDTKTLAHLLKYDSTFGIFAEEVGHGDGFIQVGGSKIKVTAIKNPAELPWKELGIDLVVESTGLFTKRPEAEKHLQAGAKKVLISAPATDPDITIVLGVNDDGLRRQEAPHHFQRLLHHQLPGAGGQGAARQFQDPQGQHDHHPLPTPTTSASSTCRTRTCAGRAPPASR